MNELVPFAANKRIFFTFREQGRLYGIDVAFIREISADPKPAPVPQAPPIVRGLVNLRSRICLVLDTGLALDGAPSQGGEGSRLIVLKDSILENLGLLVDAGGEIVSASEEQMEAAVPAGEVAPEMSVQLPSSPVVALCKLDGELMMVVDPTRIIAAVNASIQLRPGVGGM